MNKKSIIQILSLIFVILFLSACSDEKAPEAGDDANSTEAAVEHAEKHLNPLYVCPMHPKIVKNEPGSCPLCGMDLVQKKAETAVEHAQKHLNPLYVCPMHPKIVKNEPGSCPLCGMDLVTKESEAVESNHSKMDSKEDYPTIALTSDIVQKLGVRTTQVKKSRLVKKIKTVGYVSYNERRLKRVSVGTGGWVENLTARHLGLPVSKGQLMLELYSPEFIKVQKEFLATQKKDKSGILSAYGQRQESVESRDKLRYMGVPESMMNEIARKGKHKHRLPIYAPMQGVIVEHYIHKHKYVEEDETMLVIADMSTVWVEANVYEHQLEWVRQGLNAEIEVKALPGKKFTGRITYINPELDARTRTLKVRILVPNTEYFLKPNMFSEVHILADPGKKVLMLPREALIVTGKRKSVVLSLGQGKYKPVDVIIGASSEGQVEILSGLKEGVSVVTSGQFLIDSEANLQASFNRLSSQ